MKLEKLPSPGRLNTLFEATLAAGALALTVSFFNFDPPARRHLASTPAPSESSPATLDDEGSPFPEVSEVELAGESADLEAFEIAPPPPPEWTLSLKGDLTVFETPSIACLEKLVAKESTGKRRSTEPSRMKEADPNLVRQAITTAKKYRLDPMIFLAMLWHESGNFVPDATGGGTGLAQMTNVAIIDACYAIETTDCDPSDISKAERRKYREYRVQANPEYAAEWRSRMDGALSELYDTNSPEKKYPWTLACSDRPANRCNRLCGLTPRCLGQIKKKMMADNRVNLNLGAFTLWNYMGVAQKKAGRALIQDYRNALMNYNGNRKHGIMYKYPGKVFARLQALRAACPFRPIR